MPTAALSKTAQILHYSATAGRGIVGRGPARPAGNQAPKPKQHSDSSTLQRHPAAAPATKLQNATMQLFLYLK